MIITLLHITQLCSPCTHHVTPCGQHCKISKILETRHLGTNSVKKKQNKMKENVFKANYDWLFIDFFFSPSRKIIFKAPCSSSFISSIKKYTKLGYTTSRVTAVGVLPPSSRNHFITSRCELCLLSLCTTVLGGLLPAAVLLFLEPRYYTRYLQRIPSQSQWK